MLIGVALLGLIILAVGGDLILPALVVVAVIALTGIACAIFRARPFEVFVFKLKDGNFAFEIIGAGPNAVRANQFASSVAEQIRKHQTSGSA